jgi:uncharacterized damage-inducible protein DinB
VPKGFEPISQLIQLLNSRERKSGMTQRQYFIDFFKYNSWANTTLLDAIRQLPEQEEALSLLSHCLTAQNKWLNRITHREEDAAHAWSGTVYTLEELEHHLHDSNIEWLALLEQQSEESLAEQIVFTRSTDGKKLGAKLHDIILQVNYHSIHHRAQINKIISRQGLKPPATDYILTRMHEL